MKSPKNLIQPSIFVIISWFVCFSFNAKGSSKNPVAMAELNLTDTTPNVRHVSPQYFVNLRKQKTFKTLGWITLGSGAAGIIGGSLLINSGSNNANPGVKEGGRWILSTGITFALGSIPLFVASNHQRRLGVRLQENGRQNLLIPNDTFQLSAPTRADIIHLLNVQRTMKNMGTYFLVIGGATLVTGSLFRAVSSGKNISPDARNFSRVLMIGGGSLAVVSFPFLILSQYYGLRSASLSMGSQNVSVLTRGGTTTVFQPSLTVKINF